MLWISIYPTIRSTRLVGSNRPKSDDRTALDMESSDVWGASWCGDRETFSCNVTIALSELGVVEQQPMRIDLERKLGKVNLVSLQLMMDM